MKWTEFSARLRRAAQPTDPTQSLTVEAGPALFLWQANVSLLPGHHPRTVSIIVANGGLSPETARFELHGAGLASPMRLRTMGESTVPPWSVRAIAVVIPPQGWKHIEKGAFLELISRSHPEELCSVQVLHVATRCVTWEIPFPAFVELAGVETRAGKSLLLRDARGEERRLRIPAGCQKLRVALRDDEEISWSGLKITGKGSKHVQVKGERAIARLRRRVELPASPFPMKGRIVTQPEGVLVAKPSFLDLPAGAVKRIELQAHLNWEPADQGEQHFRVLLQADENQGLVSLADVIVQPRSSRVVAVRDHELSFKKKDSAETVTVELSMVNMGQGWNNGQDEFSLRLVDVRGEGLESEGSIPASQGEHLLAFGFPLTQLIVREVESLQMAVEIRNCDDITWDPSALRPLTVTVPSDLWGPLRWVKRTLASGAISMELILSSSPSQPLAVDEIEVRENGQLLGVDTSLVLSPGESRELVRRRLKPSCLRRKPRRLTARVRAGGIELSTGEHEVEVPRRGCLACLLRFVGVWLLLSAIVGWGEPLLALSMGRLVARKPPSVLSWLRRHRDDRSFLTMAVKSRVRASIAGMVDKFWEEYRQDGPEPPWRKLLEALKVEAVMDWSPSGKLEPQERIAGMMSFAARHPNDYQGIAANAHRLLVDASRASPSEKGLIVLAAGDLLSRIDDQASRAQARRLLAGLCSPGWLRACHLIQDLPPSSPTPSARIPPAPTPTRPHRPTVRLHRSPTPDRALQVALAARRAAQEYLGGKVSVVGATLTEWRSQLHNQRLMCQRIKKRIREIPWRLRTRADDDILERLSRLDEQLKKLEVDVNDYDESLKEVEQALNAGRIGAARSLLEILPEAPAGGPNDLKVRRSELRGKVAAAVRESFSKMSVATPVTRGVFPTPRQR